MKINIMRNTEKPSFCWDRDWTVGEIKERLRSAPHFERIRLTAWIMREGTFEEVWNFLTPQQVYPLLEKLLPRLGRKKEYWRYTFDAWHRLGKV